MTFQASDLKSRHFLELVNSNNNILEPSYSKGGTQLKYFGHSNTLCTRASRAITNHAPIGEYQLCFFPREEFSCPCGLNPIEMRCHILHKYRRFNEYQNPRRDSIAYFILFLELNPCVFAFPTHITQLALYKSLCQSQLASFFPFAFLYFYPFQSSCSIGHYVCSYEVAITVCLHALYNKFLILKKNNKQFHHKLVDKDTKKFNFFLIFSCKVLQDFNKREECNNIIKTGK